MPVVSPDFNATTTWTGGGYDPDRVAGGYDPNTGYVQGAGNNLGGQVAVTDNFTGAPSYAGGYAGEPTFAGGGGYDPSAANPVTGAGGFDPSAIRLGGTGGLTAGGGLTGGGSPTIGFQDSGTGAVSSSPDDWRVRVSLADNSQLFYKNSGSSSTQNQLMQPLVETNGVVFPYTPSISISHQAHYASQQLTHSNYAMQFYQSSEVSDITISGEFTVQDATEGKYLLASIYFFRACTKMFFGFDKQTGLGAGNPPPIVYLNGYGEHYFPHVPCVLSGFTHTLPPDVDYIEVATENVSLSESTGSANGGTSRATNYAYTTNTYKTRLPTSSTISITLRPVYSRKSLHEKFNLEDFAAGRLLKGNGNFL